MTLKTVPEIRVTAVNDQSICNDGDYVLYWMTANRRTRWNYSLDRAVELCIELGKPLLILEALRCDYRWASDRLHRFVIEGMADNKAMLADLPVRYYPYLEIEPGAGKGLLESLAEKACVVVADEFPCFFLPRMVSAVGKRLNVRLEQVDSNGILPLRLACKAFSRAYDFRRFLQKNGRDWLQQAPKKSAFVGVELPAAPSIPRPILERWPEATDKQLSAENLSVYPIDHDVRVAEFSGGRGAAEAALDQFLNDRLARYAEQRNQPSSNAASGFSPYLHFGHLSAHEVVAAVLDSESWSPANLSEKNKGAREGWWGLSSNAESFLDELISWREVGYNFCFHNENYDQYESLPDWSRKTLEEHADDEREHLYDLDQFETAGTHDFLWNAAQRQLVKEGRMHNYLRMLWGKKILHWSASPQAALETMIQLNNKYAVDGRNPNSYSGIFWVLGRFDRAWQERPIFGKVRYMTSESTARKLKVKAYLEKYGPQLSLF